MKALRAEVKRPEREAHHSPPSSVEVKNVCSYTFTPQYVFIDWCYSYSFTFYITASYLTLGLLKSGWPRWAGHVACMRMGRNICISHFYEDISRKMCAWKTRKEMSNKDKMGFYGDMRWWTEVHGTGSRPCPMSGFCVGVVEHLGSSITTELDDMWNVQLWIQLTWQNEQYFFETQGKDQNAWPQAGPYWNHGSLIPLVPEDAFALRDRKNDTNAAGHGLRSTRPIKHLSIRDVHNLTFSYLGVSAL
jgi:hypothetical protein